MQVNLIKVEMLNILMLVSPARKVCSRASMYCLVYCRVPSLESLTLGTVCPSGNLALGTMVTYSIQYISQQLSEMATCCFQTKKAYGRCASSVSYRDVGTAAVC